MKSIAIFGSSRSGKSTLAKMIAKKYQNYHIIIGDDIQWAFQETLPNNNINNSGGSGMIHDFPNFLSCLFYKSMKRNQGELNYIVESCDITPNKANDLFNNNNTILLFLGTPNQTPEEYFHDIKKYQTKKDWTFDRSDEHLLKHSKHWIEKSKEYQSECKKLGIWFVDTSFNREKVLQETLEKIIANNK